MDTQYGDQAVGRLVRDERRSIESGKPCDDGPRTDPSRLETQQLVRARGSGENLQRAIARRGISDRPVEAIRPPYAVAPMRHCSNWARSFDVAARSLLPRMGSPQSFCGRRLFSAHLGWRQPGAHDCRPGASRHGSHRQDRSPVDLGRGTMAYDYIIVGGGPAGCVLANRLSTDPLLTVLLLEAGGSDWNPLFRMPAGFVKMTKGVASWGWSTVPQKHLNGRVVWYTQAKVIGGGSSINAQLYTRGNAKDYDVWASDAGATGWSYREVLPYFKQSEDNQKLHNAYHGYGGPLGVSYPINPLPISYAFLRAAQELGIPFNDDFNGAVQDGIGHYQLSTRNAERSSASTAFVKPIEGRKNLTVRLNAQTLKIEVQNGRAFGVTVVAGTGTETLNADREIIVSCGSIGSPRLLQLSGIGPADALKAAGVEVV